MQHRFSIREASINDAFLISQLASVIWKAHYPSIISNAQIDYMLNERYAEHTIKSSMEHGERFFLLYEGAICKAYASLEDRETDIYLHKFYVLVDSHRNGIGQQLFTHVLTETGSIKPLRLQVNRKNVKAINFYFKNGFTIEKAQDFDIGNGFQMEDFVMVRR